MCSDYPVSFEYEVGGVTVTMSMSEEDAAKIVGWSTSEVILHLGSQGPLLIEGLRKIFGGK